MFFLISAGRGINSTNYNSTLSEQGLVSARQFWNLGLQ
jgi:hypothetical protein